MKRFVVAAWLPAALGCSSFETTSTVGTVPDASGDVVTHPAVDASHPVDAPVATDARDSAARDASDAHTDADAIATDAGSSTDGALDDGGPIDAGTVDSGLNPELVVPPASGTSCDPSQGDEGCSGGKTCRIASTTGGRCDSVTSGAEGTSPCAIDSDCDDTLQCFNGECKVLCPLGMTCAGGCECFNVGNLTTGICCPGS